MKARVSQLHKTEAEWAKFADWVPSAGEFVVFDPDNIFKHSRVKLGDGNRPLKDLSFFVDSAVADYIKQTRYEELLDAGRVTDYKK